MSTIAITKNEFDLIIKKESHPVFEIIGEGDMVEEQSGCDILYKYNVLNKETKEMLSIEVVHNYSYGDFQDQPQDGDFHICEIKKDIYDSYGELLSEKVIDVKPEFYISETEKELTNEEKQSLLVEKYVSGYKDAKEKGIIKSVKTLRQFLHLITEAELIEVYSQSHSILIERSKTATFSEANDFQNNIVRKICFENHIDLQDAWNYTWLDVIHFNKNSKYISLDETLRHYLSEKNLDVEKKIMVEIGGKLVEISESEIRKIKAL